MAECPPRGPAGEPVDRPDDSYADQSLGGAPAVVAHGIAPHEEVCRLPTSGAVAQEQPPLLAHTPSSTHAEARRSPAGSGGLPYPDTGISPLELRAAGGADQKVTRAAGFDWPEPETLLQRLDSLAAEWATSHWATRTARLVRKLGPAVSQGSDESTVIIRELREPAIEATALAATLDDKVLARELCRTGYALSRRLAVWEPLVESGDWSPIPVQVVQPHPEQLSLCLAGIDEITGDSARGKAWREYLLVDALREWSGKAGPPKDRLPRRLAQRVLRRLTQVRMSSQQRQFVSTEPVVALQTELRRLAAEPVDAAELLRHLERYEKTGLASDARLLAADWMSLKLNGSGDQRRLAERLEANYRNANLRVAVTEELLDRLMPERNPEYAQVHETVLGQPVSGRSLTSTEVGVRLLPDPNRVRLALEITGQVASLTSSTSGPATFFNRSTSLYTARKPVEVDLQGIRRSPADIEVESDTRLRKLETDFDGIPLFGVVVSRIARSQHAQKHAAINSELRQKVALKARRRIDAEADARLGEISEKLRQRVVGPLEASRLEPTIISAKTTDRRLAIRLRLAGEDQLGGHTPRPQAPSDSLASLQIHETAINNALERLALRGRTFTLAELSRHIATQLSFFSPWEIDPEHEDVTVTFAQQDPVRVRLRDGQAFLSLAISRLDKSPRHWSDFKVHVRYRPRLTGRSAWLSRDGIVQLGGARISTGSQIALRGIFAKVFSRRRSWRLTPERLATNPKFADVAVTQFVVEDGWFGLALGPRQTAVRPAVLRR